MGVPGLENQYKELDGQIESLMKCTPLPEAEVKVLCDKAREILQVLGLSSWSVKARLSFTRTSNPLELIVSNRGALTPKPRKEV